MEYFEKYHTRNEEGRFIVPPFPGKSTSFRLVNLGLNRSVGSRKLMERSLRTKGIDQDFQEVMREYFNLGHAERVPLDEVDSPTTEVYYLPMHAVHKEDSTISKLRIVFDTSVNTCMKLQVLH